MLHIRKIESVVKQSCVVNMMTWTQLKQRMVYIHDFFRLKFLKMENLFTFLALKQSNSEECIFAVYKYS